MAASSPAEETKYGLHRFRRGADGGLVRVAALARWLCSHEGTTLREALFELLMPPLERGEARLYLMEPQHTQRYALTVDDAVDWYDLRAPRKPQNVLIADTAHLGTGVPGALAALHAMAEAGRFADLEDLDLGGVLFSANVRLMTAAQHAQLQAQETRRRNDGKCSGVHVGSPAEVEAALDRQRQYILKHYPLNLPEPVQLPLLARLAVSEADAVGVWHCDDSGLIPGRRGAVLPISELEATAPLVTTSAALALPAFPLPLADWSGLVAYRTGGGRAKDWGQGNQIDIARAELKRRTDDGNLTESAALEAMAKELGLGGREALRKPLSMNTTRSRAAKRAANVAPATVVYAGRKAT